MAKDLQFAYRDDAKTFTALRLHFRLIRSFSISLLCVCSYRCIQHNYNSSVHGLGQSENAKYSSISHSRSTYTQRVGSRLKKTTFLRHEYQVMNDFWQSIFGMHVKVNRCVKQTGWCSKMENDELINLKKMQIFENTQQETASIAVSCLMILSISSSFETWRIWMQFFHCAFLFGGNWINSWFLKIECWMCVNLIFYEIFKFIERFVAMLRLLIL